MFETIKVHVEQEFTFCQQLLYECGRLNTLLASERQQLELLCGVKLLNDISDRNTQTAVNFWFPHGRLQVSGAPLKDCNGIYDLYDSNTLLYTHHNEKYHIQCTEDRVWVLGNKTTNYYVSNNIYNKPSPGDVTSWKTGKLI